MEWQESKKSKKMKSTRKTKKNFQHRSKTRRELPNAVALWPSRYPSAFFGHFRIHLYGRQKDERKLAKK